MILLPLGVIANLALGVYVLAGLEPQGWTGWLQLGAGAFCCVVAGWLSAVVVSTSYWNRSSRRQIWRWRQITDTFFGWLEDAPLPEDALQHLRTSLDKVVPTSERS